ncbi:MAG: HEAT repeat domain-containing protein [Nitrospirae bacterium]|nr:HEAT repeat domain-containing protein [Nitrospirota bacterium]
MDAEMVDLVEGLDNLHGNLNVQARLIGLGQRAVPALVAFLNGPPSRFPDGRVLAAEALGAMRGEEAINGLIAILSANPLSRLSPVLRLSEETVRNAAARELSRIGDRRAIEPLLMALQENRPVGAAEALVAFGEERAIPFLVEGLEDAFKRDSLAEAILSFGQAAVPSLLESLQVRHTHAGTELLPSIERRTTILRWLGKLEMDAAVEPIISALDDEHASVRLEAAIAASRVVRDDRVERAIPILTEGLSHPDFLHRDRCRDALDEISRSRVVSQAKHEGRHAE